MITPWKMELIDEGKKLKPIHYGLFIIIKQIGDNAFQLELLGKKKKPTVD